MSRKSDNPFEDPDPKNPLQAAFLAARRRGPKAPDPNGPGAKRTAFRHNPHGVLDLGDVQVARVEQCVRKSGKRVRIEESRAMQFASSLELPVPTVHEAKVCDKRTDILMDFVDGECLEEAWPSMNTEQKRSIAEQLGRIITSMRQAAPTQPSIGSFGGPARDLRHISDYSGGPFDTEAEFNSFVLDFYRQTPPLIRSTLTKAFDCDSRIVFTHGDLAPRNIIVKGDQIQALLDWELAGWYPEYWEYVKFFDRPTGCSDWRHYAESIFATQYPRQLLTFQALARWQRS